MVSTAVIGARGYLGRELVRLLLQHPNVDKITPVTSGEAGSRYGDSVPAFRHRTDLIMQNATHPDVREADVIFLATDAEEARKQVTNLADAPLIIDLSRAHRQAALSSTDATWHYGMSEFFDVPKGTTRIANPGCYPTATMMASGAALQAGVATAGPLIADGKSGISGAGATPRGDLHYPDAHDVVRAYKVLGHDHLGEIRGAAQRLDGHSKPLRPVRFTPHLVPMNRGLLATVYLPTDADAATVQKAYEQAYQDLPFVRLVQEPDTSHVRHSNFADVAVSVDEEAGLIVARCAIDNLIKGGSGTAVQNMNLALGLSATTGLDAIGGGP